MCPGKDGHSQCMRAEYTATQLDFNEQISEMEPQRRSWHLMRHPGLCGLRAVICALIVLALCVVLTLIPRKGTDPEPVMNGTASVSHTLGPRRLRETANGYMASLSDSWMDHPSPPHPYATDMWWRLANHTVKEYGSKNCYVCTRGGSRGGARGAPAPVEIWLAPEVPLSCQSSLIYIKLSIGCVGSSFENQPAQRFLTTTVSAVFSVTVFVAFTGSTYSKL